MHHPSPPFLFFLLCLSVGWGTKRFVFTCLCSFSALLFPFVLYEYESEKVKMEENMYDCIKKRELGNQQKEGVKEDPECVFDGGGMGHAAGGCGCSSQQVLTASSFRSLAPVDK